MTHYNDNARNALDIDKATKADLNNALLYPLSASALKKTSRADLVAMIEAQDAPKAKKPARILDDRVIQEPGKVEDVRPTKEGSKRALLVMALQRGATIEHLMEVLGWNRETVSSAFRTDIKAIGLGVERRKGKYHLMLPKGMKKLPLRDATTSRADALVAACR